MIFFGLNGLFWQVPKFGCDGLPSGKVSHLPKLAYFVSPFYLNGTLKSVTIIRDRMYPGGVTAGEALKGDSVKIKRGLVTLRGVCTRVHDCIDKNYDYTVAYELFINFKMYLLRQSAKRFAYWSP